MTARRAKTDVPEQRKKLKRQNKTERKLRNTVDCREVQTSTEVVNNIITAEQDSVEDEK